MQINFHQGQDIGRRDEQQDALGNLVLSPQKKLYVLADGMGGQQGGQLASRTVVNAFLAYFQQAGAAQDAGQALRQALSRANQALAQVLAERPELDGMGTTVVAVLLDEADNRYDFVSVGDSPLYCLRGGRLQRINANHAFFEDLKNMVASGDLTQEEADRHPARHAVTSAVMGKDIPHTDTGSGQLRAGELLLLASDGLQTLDDSAEGEIQAVLSVSGSLEDKTGRLLDAVRGKQAPHQDNTSLILVQAAAGEEPSVPAPQTETPATRLNTVHTPAADTPQANAGAPRKTNAAKILLAAVLLAVLGAAALWWGSSRTPSVPQEPLPNLPDASEAPAVSAPVRGLPQLAPPEERAPSDVPPSEGAAPKQEDVPASDARSASSA